jgi:hypothetical protein
MGSNLSLLVTILSKGGQELKSGLYCLEKAEVLNEIYKQTAELKTIMSIHFTHQ